MKQNLFLLLSALSMFFIMASSCSKDKEDSADFSEKSKILDLVNEVRAKGCNCGDIAYDAVGPVSWNDKLALAATRHSEDMVKNNYFDHTSKDGKTPSDRILAAGYQWVTYGENIAKGYDTPEGVLKEWLNSEGHCKNIMNPKFKEMGVGKSGAYWTQVFGTKKETIGGQGISKEKILAVVNRVRSKGAVCGGKKYPSTSPVTWNDKLALAAIRHSQDMLNKKYFSHTSKDGKTVAHRIKATGYSWDTYGENIAKGQTSEEQVVQWWLKSEGHCRNIMNPSFKEMGVGRQGNYWTQVFGTPKGTLPVIVGEKAKMLDLVNKARAKGAVCGGKKYAPAGSVSWNDKLALAAKRHSQDMLNNNYFDHTSKDGRSPADRIKAVGYRYRTYGENIAYGYTTEKQVVEGWLKSPGHCKNIMNPAFKEMGVGRVKNHWTQVFGTR